MHRSRDYLSLFVTLSAVFILWGCGPEISDDPDIVARLPEKVDYNFHVKPLLSDRCFACHGPDEAAREADLRLDLEAGAKEARLESGGHAIVERSLRKSEVFRRIHADDPDVMMPPPESNLKLSEYEKALISKWIDQGAEYKRHWSLIPPKAQPAPKVDDGSWTRNDIDRFILARLEGQGLEPSPEAAKERLLSRVTMDLTGLPPSIDDVESFLADDRPGAYERRVDSLLKTDAHAERMALEWMDVARYADSHGYHADGSRRMWPWRDWVIEAFAQNMPYDRFVTLQLAGDLLPDASREQILPTAFLRNHPINSEGGIVGEEYRFEYVVDRTNTFGKAFLGLGVECAQCHDHKYDPISQKNYYQLTAFFNNIEERGMAANDGNAGPVMDLPDESQEEQLKAIRRRIADVQRAIKAREREVKASERLSGDIATPDAPLAHHPLDRIAETRRLDISGEPKLIDGPRGKAVELAGDFDYIELEGIGRFENYDPFTAMLWVRPEEKRSRMAQLIGNSGDKNSNYRGWDVYLDSLNRVTVRLIDAHPDNLIRVRTTDSVSTDAWNHVAVSYDGSSTASGVKVYLDGRRANVEIEHDQLRKSILPVNAEDEPIDRGLRIGKSYRSLSGDRGKLTGGVDDVRVYDSALSGIDLAGIHGTDLLSEIKDTAPALRTEAQKSLLREHYLYGRDATYKGLMAELRSLRKQEQEVLADVPTIMVMKEREKRRPTYVRDRGVYSAYGEKVTPDTPESVLAFPEDLEQNRLGLAKWLFMDENPLTARVAVNRYWQMLFGTGLVRTSEDFGAQGELPTHPKLLDHLAVWFRESGWNVRALLKKVVMSATYRQASDAHPEIRRKDPDNRLLAHAPSFRLPAEFIRDKALAASGLLVSIVGGPSVKPYQPPRLWEEKGELSHDLHTYKQDSGDALYRRSLYTFIRRTSPPPNMNAFDAPNRTSCVVRRQTTNTPLQALILMNDPHFVEAARVLAERMQRQGGDKLSSQLNTGFRLLTGRDLRDEELSVFKHAFEEERTRFQKDREAARALLSVGEYSRNDGFETTRTAALAIVASLMMNHDEAYMRR